MTEERNFCPRCGKRRGGDANYIHTCTPPQPKREWVELTGVEINHIFAANVGYPERMMKEVAKLLKEKNNG